jgi:hypothetical protein
MDANELGKFDCARHVVRRTVNVLVGDAVGGAVTAIKDRSYRGTRRFIPQGDSPRLEVLLIASRLWPAGVHRDE